MLCIYHEVESKVDVEWRVMKQGIGWGKLYLVLVMVMGVQKVLVLRLFLEILPY